MTRQRHQNADEWAAEQEEFERERREAESREAERREVAACWSAHPSCAKAYALEVIAGELGITVPQLRKQLYGSYVRTTPRVPCRDQPSNPPRAARPRGRPRRADIDREAVYRLLREGRSERAIETKLGIPRTTLARFIAREELAAPARYGPLLTEDHARLLLGSAVSPAVAQMRGYRSDARRGELAIPLWDISGKRSWVQYRVDSPKTRRVRYRNPRDARRIVDVSPYARGWVLDQSRPLFLTESPRKADAAVSIGLACIAIAGWRLSCTIDGQWSGIPLRGRTVYVVPDSDVATNREVLYHVTYQLQYLVGRAARVYQVRLPGPHKGLDDHIAAGMREADLVALARPENQVEVRHSEGGFRATLSRRSCDSD